MNSGRNQGNRDGQGQGRSGGGRGAGNDGRGSGGGGGRNRGGGFGPGGFCVCAGCGEKVPHRLGEKCTAIKCPKCGKTMIREELLDRKKEG